MRGGGVDDVACALQQQRARGLGWGRGHGVQKKANPPKWVGQGR